MKKEFSLLPLVAMIALIGAGTGAGTARADSAVGVDTLLGSAQNPGGLDKTAAPDERGFSPVMGGKGPSHTPGGQLYAYPGTLPEPRPGVEGWEYTASIEAGYVGKDGKEKAAGFREYTDWDNGAVVSSFGLAAEKPETASYVRLRGGAVGRDDQYYGLEAGRYNGFKFSAFYNETPHVFATNARPLWNGVGTGNLTLPAGLTAGTHTQADPASYAALQAAVAAAGETTLSVERKKVGVRLDAPLSEGVNGFMSYTNERREGTRPFGGAFIFDFIRRSPSNPVGNNVFGAVMETVEPIDYTSHEFLTGLRYVGEKDRLNVTLSGSLFRNDIKSLTWENPFSINYGVAGTVNSTSWERGRFALSPDNEAYNLKAEYARVLPLQGQFNATVAVGRMLQDDDLLPPTINDGVNASGATTTYAGAIAGYNTTSVLSQKTANARIDTQLADLGASFKPQDDLTLRAKLRYYDEDNKTRYTAIDPATGKIGYVPLDYGLPGVFGANFGFYNGINNLHYKSIPTSYSKWNGGVGADYQASRFTQLGVSYDREEIDRAHREVRRTYEDRLKFSVNSRAFERATLRASYEYGDRRGSEYNPDPYHEFYTASLAGYAGSATTLIHTLAELRKYDLADRKQHIVNARWNYMLRSDVDTFISFQHKLSDFDDSAYGRTGDDKQDTVNLELNFNPAPGKSFYTYYSFQKAALEQGNINNANTPALRTSDAAGGDMYPLSGAWTAAARDTNHTVGAGLAYDFGLVRLESRYSYSWAKTRQSYAYADAAGATVGSGTNETQTAAVAGNEFSDMTYRLQTLETSLVRPLSKNTAVRLFHRWEQRNTADWHYSGLDGNLLINQKLYLGATPQDYNVNVLGVFVQHRL